MSLQGAQVLEWTPVGQQQSVLYLSPDATFESGRAIRGGVPVCWPWFGASVANPSLPSHGFARIRPWELVDAVSTLVGVDLLLQLASDESTRALWPFDFVCQLRIHLGATLRITLTTENTGNTAFVVTEALHTYVRVGDIEQVMLTGLDDTLFLDTVGVPALRNQLGDITFDTEVDRQYASTGPVTVIDGALQRTVVVNKSGSSTTVVWNPWREKTARLADLSDTAWRDFVCVEAGNAGSDAEVVVRPGEKHSLQSELSLRRVSATFAG